MTFVETSRELWSAMNDLDWAMYPDMDMELPEGGDDLMDETVWRWRLYPGAHYDDFDSWPDYPRPKDHLLNLFREAHP